MKAEARVLRSALMFERLRKQALEKPSEAKGFLGPSLREKPDTPSIGRRVALGRGLIVDDAGKMRCPAGTPNANQFTDLQMSNCMIPSAETAANEAVDAVANAVQSVSRLEPGETPTLKKFNPSPDAARIRKKNDDIIQSIKAQGGDLDNKTPEFIEQNGSGLFSLSQGLITKQQHTAQRREIIRGTIETLQEVVRLREDDGPLSIEETRELISSRKPDTSTLGGAVGRFSGTEEEKREYLRQLQLTVFGGKFDEGTTRKGVSPKVLAMLRTATPEEIEEELEKAAIAFHEGLDPRVHVNIPVSRVSSIISEGRYKTTHEARSEHSAADVRTNYEVTIGIPSSATADVRPASGYVVHKDWEAAKKRRRKKTISEVNSDKVEEDLVYSDMSPEGPVGIYGNVVVRLKPEVSGRTRYGWGDSFNNMIDPVKLESEQDTDEILNALISRRFKNGGRTENIAAVATFLDASLNGDFLRMRSGMYAGGEGATDTGINDDNYAEALVMGSFDLTDIEEIEMGFNNRPWMPRKYFPQPAYNISTKENADEFADSVTQVLDETISEDILREMGANAEELEIIQRWVDDYLTMVRNTNSPRLPNSSDGIFAYDFAGALDNYLSMVSMSELREDISDKGIKLKLVSPNGLDRWNIKNYSEADQQIGDILEIWKRRVASAALKDARHKIEWSKRPPAESSIRDF